MNIFKQASLSLLAVMVFVLGLGVCKSESNFGEEFVRKSSPEQHRLILSYPLDQQVDLYLKTMLERHPPDLGLADVVASHGADIVPILRARLATEDQDINKMHLIDVFYKMQVRGYYSVAADSEIIVLLENQAEMMVNDPWKRLTSETITQIKEAAGLRPSEAAQ